MDLGFEPKPADSQAGSFPSQVPRRSMPNPVGTTQTAPLFLERTFGFLSFHVTQRKSLEGLKWSVWSMKQREEGADSGSSGFPVAFHSLIFSTVERLAV